MSIESEQIRKSDPIESSSPTSDRLLNCVHSTEKIGQFGNYDAVALYEPGKSGDDYVIKKLSGEHDTQYWLNLDGKKYADGFKKAGDDPLVVEVSPGSHAPFPEVRKGSVEYNKILQSVQMYEPELEKCHDKK